MYNDENLHTITDLRVFLASPASFTVTIIGTSTERAAWIYERLVRFKYLTCRKPDKGTILRYLLRVIQLTEKQLDRHISAYKQGAKLCRSYQRNTFASRYTHEDSQLLAEVDNATGRLAGGPTVVLIRNQYATGDQRFERLRQISVAQLYRLRAATVYKEKALTVAKTKSINLPIGERRKPESAGKPGFIRIDTVHQGDWNGNKGVYHINLVDEVTQWEVVVAVEEISESYLLPALRTALSTFPFKLRNFHSDNGSEFINYRVARLLEKLRIAQTKSRPRKSTDNGLIETKNGAIIRKELGHWHIPRAFAVRINRFYQEHLIPYLNFHRPCHFPEKGVQANGKVRIRYPNKNCQTPYQKLRSVPHFRQCLRSGVTVTNLNQQATAKTPLEAALEKKQARDKLLKIVLPKLSGTLLPKTITE